MASVDPKDKAKPHVTTSRTIKWKGAAQPVYIKPGQKDENGKLITFTLDHVDDAAYLTLMKRKARRLATAEELKNAVVLKSGSAGKPAEVNDGKDS